MESESSEEDEDIGDLLGDGGSKLYIPAVIPKEVGVMQSWLLENETKIVEDFKSTEGNFNHYLSWQTADSTPEQQQPIQPHESLKEPPFNSITPFDEDREREEQ